MIDVRELRINNLVLKENPNTKQNEICKVFCINSGDNRISLERLGKSIDEGGSIMKICINKEDRYIFPVNPVDINCVEGFTITEGILLISGFKLCSKTINQLCSDVYRLNIDKCNVVFEAVGGTVMVLSNGNCLCNNITTFHQLQNIYFDLTGQELEVNL